MKSITHLCWIVVPCHRLVYARRDAGGRMQRRRPRGLVSIELIPSTKLQRMRSPNLVHVSVFGSITLSEVVVVVVVVVKPV